MRIIAQPEDLLAHDRPVHAAVGVFDGVHRGHQAVIAQAAAEARATGGVAVVITFDRHPQSVVSPATAPALIQPLDRKLAAIAALGVEAALVFQFDEAFSRRPAGEFALNLQRGLGRLATISVGGNCFFGHRRAGNVALLKEFGARLGFQVHDAVPVMHAGQPISSTRVRAAIRAGDLGEVSAMLGRPYALSGRVLPGDQLGRRLGFPTANLDITGLELPPRGVYAARVAGPGLNQPAVVNLGLRPTLDNPRPTLQFEAHLLDWSGDLYGRDLDVELRHFLRSEQKFASREALKEQIGRDVAEARQFFLS
jgi:riboflavin kinase/FMN adenylyltransferase